MDASVRNTRLLYAFWTLRDFQLWIPVWIVFLIYEQGFTLTQITFAEGLYLVGVVLLEVPTGAVADRWGRSKSLALGAFTLAGAVLVFAFATNFTILLVSFFMWSLATTLMSGADLALLFETLKASGEEEKYERIAGRGIAFTWGGVGIATLLGGPVAEIISTEATIYIGAATCVVTGLVALLMWDAPHTAPGDAVNTRYFATIGRSFKETWQNTTIRPVVLLTGTVIAGMESTHYLVQPYLIDRGIEIGGLFSLMQVPIFLAGLSGAFFAARVKSASAGARLLILLPSIGMLACATLAGAPGLTGYLALPVLVALVSTIDPVATGIVNRAAPSDRRATILSISGMMRSLVMAVMAPVIGFLADGYSLSTAFAACGAVVVVALVLFGAPVFARRKLPLAVDASPA